MEDVSIPFMREWKSEFEKIIRYFQNTYKIIFCDYKGCTDISGNHYFYADVNHLNTVGARCLTTLMMREL